MNATSSHCVRRGEFPWQSSAYTGDFFAGITTVRKKFHAGLLRQRRNLSVATNLSYHFFSYSGEVVLNGLVTTYSLVLKEILLSLFFSMIDLVDEGRKGLLLRSRNPTRRQCYYYR